MQSPKHRETTTTYAFLGATMRVLLTGDDTCGQFTMIEGTMPPGGDGGLHVHHREDESMTLQEGVLNVTIGEQTFQVLAGQSYFAPRGVPHRVWNAGSVPARGVLVMTPCGFDTFLAAAGTPVSDAAAPPLAAPTADQIGTLLRLAGEHGIEVLAPPAGLSF